MNDNKLLEIFQSTVKSKILTEDIDKYLSDWRGVYKGNTKFVIFPQTTLEVSKIVKLANKFNIPIVPQGGNTGLCGGATPDKSGNSILINLSKLNKIRSIDDLNTAKGSPPVPPLPSRRPAKRGITFKSNLPNDVR